MAAASISCSASFTSTACSGHFSSLRPVSCGKVDHSEYPQLRRFQNSGLSVTFIDLRDFDPEVCPLIVKGNPSMRYISTRNSIQPIPFKDAIMMGLATNDGL